MTVMATTMPLHRPGLAPPESPEHGAVHRAQITRQDRAMQGEKRAGRIMWDERPLVGQNPTYLT